jgi:hypothetical protein
MHKRPKDKEEKLRASAMYFVAHRRLSMTYRPAVVFATSLPVPGSSFAKFRYGTGYSTAPPGNQFLMPQSVAVVKRFECHECRRFIQPSEIPADTLTISGIGYA